jgi:phosphatidylserine/phosphatidylglycerophosphate/cardiolipin synthase-like enzyme
MYPRLLVAMTLLAACGQSGSSGPDAHVTGDGGPPGGDGGPGVDGGGPTPSVAIIVEPNGNDDAELVSAIKAAHTSVYMTMYELDHPAVLSALVGRKQAGLDVQAVLDGSSVTKAFNTAAFNQLKAAGISVVWSSSSFTYTHEKCVMIDGQVAWIMTMNLAKSPPSSNREYLAIDSDAADVAEATAIFKADHGMQTISPSGGLVVAPVNARPKLVALINSATTTLDVEGEEFSDNYSTGVVNAVAAAASRGVKVRVIIANGALNASSVATVKSAGGKVVMTGPGSSGGTLANPYIHAKAILVDCSGTTCAKGFVGSENFSGGSLGYNRELGVIFTNTSELAKVKTAIDKDFANGVAQ